MPIVVIGGTVTEVPEAAIWRGPPDRARARELQRWLYPVSGRFGEGRRAWIMKRLASGALIKWQFCGDYS